MASNDLPQSGGTKSADLTKPVAIGTLCHPIESANLFGDSKEVFIRHGEEMYRLTITRNGKLILQK